MSFDINSFTSKIICDDAIADTVIETEKRENEFEAWYQAWLDVTETLEKPIKPEWI